MYSERRERKSLRQNSIRWILPLSCAAAAVCAFAAQKTSAPQSKGQHMTTRESLEMTLSFKEKNGARLVPEECAYFNVAMRNDGTREAQFFDLDNNSETPVYSLYDGSGKKIASVSHQTMMNRMSGGGMGEPMPEPPSIRTLAAGKTVETFLDLWNYMAPPPKGVYELGAADRLPSGQPELVESNRLRFEIVDAQVRDVAFGYEDIQRTSSLLLWVAVPEGNGQALLLARLSTLDMHRVAQWSGNPLGSIDVNARLAIAGKPLEGTSSAIGWFAAVEGQHVELIQHFRTNPNWRSGKIALPISDPQPVPGFPDREYAVFLATGTATHGAALAGARVHPEGPKAPPWTVPLDAVPVYSACAFGKAGPIALLFVSTQNGQEHLSRMDVDADGKIDAPQKTVRTSSNLTLAIAVDQRPGNPQQFVVLESDPAHSDRLFLVHVPLSGEPQVRDIPRQAGWPTGPQGPAHARSVSMQIGWDGRPVIALTDDAGRNYAGVPGEGSLMELGSLSNGSHAIGLHVAALRRSIEFGAFTDRGNLKFLRGLH
jgi:hypothetical protein